jgi:hypothetical protein
VFPLIVAVRKPVMDEEEFHKVEGTDPVQVCPVPREYLEHINLSQYINQEGYKVPWDRFAEMIGV